MNWTFSVSGIALSRDVHRSKGTQLEVSQSANVCPTMQQTLLITVTAWLVSREEEHETCCSTFFGDSGVFFCCCWYFCLHISGFWVI